MLLAEPGHLMRIGTVDEDGWPRVVPTWFVFRDGQIWFTLRQESVFLANLRREPRVALSIDEEPLPYRKITVQGTARLVHDVGEDDVWRDQYRAIARRYIPEEAVEAYVTDTIDQPRALLAVPLHDSRVSTWRMPIGDEKATGIWAKRYYLPGTKMEALAGTGDGPGSYVPTRKLVRDMLNPVSQDTSGEPTTDRGRRTRNALIRGARRVFEKKGFLDARIVDITRSARVSYGTFYTYFPSKEAVFRELVYRTQEDFGPMPHADSDQLTVWERIDRANREYFEAYKRNARMMAIIEQVATFNDEFRQLRRETRYAAMNRSERAIERWQQAGLVPSDLNARYAASALGSMVDRSIYVWFVLGEPFEEGPAISTLNLLCTRALGLPVGPAAEAARSG
jgi:AcrR family transcriptional regulator